MPKQVPLIVKVDEGPASESVQSVCSAAIGRLARSCALLTHCEVSVSGAGEPGRHDACEVTVRLGVPGGELVVTRRHEPRAGGALESAVRDVLDQAGRQLRDHVHRHRGVGEPPAPPEPGGACQVTEGFHRAEGARLYLRPGVPGDPREQPA